MVSSDFGKLDVRRQLISGDDCAIACRATAVAAAPAAETFKKSRRFIQVSLRRGVSHIPRAVLLRGAFHVIRGAPAGRVPYSSSWPPAGRIPRHPGRSGGAALTRKFAFENATKA